MRQLAIILDSINAYMNVKKGAGVEGNSHFRVKVVIVKPLYNIESESRNNFILHFECYSSLI